ncbi:MAG: transcriptional regulator [Betaproteobacteria bacterium]|nr:MAG: transcriptional regulator [Betaproteobacteria bacterium]
MGPRTSLGDSLFSGVQQRVLGVLFGTPDKSFYRNELMRLTGSGKGALQRELDRLEQSGLVTVRPVGNQKHYQANKEAPIFEELRGIVVKTFGVADVVRRALLPLAKAIAAAFIFGSIAKRSDTSASDIDVFVVSDKLGYQDLIKALLPAEAVLGGRKINPTIHSRAELARKRKERASFVARVLEQPKIFLIGSERDLG